MGTVGQAYENGASRVSIRGGLVLPVAAPVSGCARPGGPDVRRRPPLAAPPAPAAELQDKDAAFLRIDTRPALFRPPYGNHDEDTLRAAKSCDRWEDREWDRKVRPGDIVLSRFRGRGLDKVTAEGYAVARIEDYL